MPSSSDKPALRKHYRALRDAIPAEQREERSDAIARMVQTIERYQHAGSVFVYVSVGSEVGTHALIKAALDAGKTVAVPRVMQGQGVMQPIVIRSLSDFAPGRFGIPEPTTHERFDTSPDLAIVPGLAFTRDGLRLGQGGGFYDRYLAQHPATYKVGLCFDPQLADTLLCDGHDVTMDEVITA